MNCKKRLAVALGLVVSLAAGSAHAAPAAPLKVGYSDWPGFVAFQVAIDKGWIKQAGLDVKFEWFDYSASMDAFAAGCPTFQGGCPLGSDPRAQVAKAISTLDNARGAGPGSGNTNGGSVLLTLLLRLGSPSGWPQLATALAAASAGNPASIEEMLRDSLGLSGSTGWLNAAIIYGCNDNAERISPEQMSAAVASVKPQAPMFGPYTVGLVGICTSWPAPESALGAVKATGAAPILVAGAVQDPQAPYQAVRSLAGQLGSATLISWQSGQHGSYPQSPCVTAAVDAYLLKGTLPAVGSLCPP